jgi:hypothetical protein
MSRGDKGSMPGFATTRWSLILKASPGPDAAREALEHICRDYRARFLPSCDAPATPPRTPRT